MPYIVPHISFKEIIKLILSHYCDGLRNNAACSGAGEDPLRSLRVG